MAVCVRHGHCSCVCDYLRVLVMVRRLGQQAHSGGNACTLDLLCACLYSSPPFSALLLTCMSICLPVCLSVHVRSLPLTHTHSHTGGPNVYEGVRIDYRGADVTAENFLSVLLGDKAAMSGKGTGRVVDSGPHDKVSN